jgi:hypothetical protein
MYEGQMVFPQVLEFLSRRVFDSCVRRYQGNRRIRGFSCRDQFLAMAFAQLTGRESLRDLEICLRAVSDKLYHAGFRGSISRSTLADANRTRDWQIYRDLGLALIERARRLYAADDLGIELTHTAYALDATVIELCLNLFPWAHSQRQKAAIKVHTLLDLRGNIPCFLRISSTKTRDCALLDDLPIEPGSFYLMDRDYNDYRRLHRIHRAGAFFVVRAKCNLTVRRQASRTVDRSTGLRSDQTVLLRDRRTRRKYPDRLRRICYKNLQTGRRLIFVTNHFDLTPLTITELYRQRWALELFFKWVKQHLRIKHFLGNTPNAVKTQLWIAVSTYVLVAIMKRELKIERSLAEILQILSVTLFEKTPLSKALSQQTLPISTNTCPNQMCLFDF